MSKGLRIGKAGARNFTLPLEVATQAMALHGVRGKGKTVTASVIVEELLKQGVQVVIVDPTDSWFGLKSSSDGTKPGHPVVILGGPRGDLPLTGTSGRVIADFVVERGVSMILSLRHLRKGDARRFVTEFAEQLFHRKGEPEHRTPLFLVIDECSQYVPQRVLGESARMVGAIQDCVRMGRNVGLGVALIDQRPATVNKDVLTQVELLVCHAVTSPQDRKALDEWIRGHDSAGRGPEFLEGLASLERGEAWFWFPIADVFERVHVRMRETFDSSKTPKLGEAAAAPERTAEIDMDALRSALEDTVAEAEANDPKTLKRRIAELERELRDAETLYDAPDPEEAAERIRDQVDQAVSDAVVNMQGRVQKVIAGIRNRTEALEQALGALQGELGALDDFAGDEDLFGDVMDATERPVRVPTPRAPRPAPAPAVARAAPARRAAATRAPAAPAEGVSVPQQRILDALAGLEALGLHEVDRGIVAVFADQSPRSSGFANNLGRLRNQLGLIDYPGGGMVSLTDAGRAVADAESTPTTLAGLHDAWASKLSNPQAAILRALVKIYPDAIAREVLADLTGQSPTSSGYANNLGRMRSLGIVDYPAGGHVVATELLFPRGLR